MGVDYRAVIIVGLRREDINNVEKLIDEGGDFPYPLWECSTYDDGCGDDRNVVGIVVAKSPDYGNEELDLSTFAGPISDALDQFFAITGQHGKTYLSTHGY